MNGWRTARIREYLATYPGPSHFVRTILIFLLASVKAEYSEPEISCPKVTSMNRNEVGLGGQSFVEIHGCGFEETAFEIENGLPTEGNRVLLEYTFQTLEARVTEQGPNAIIFETPPGQPGLYRIRLLMNGRFLPDQKMCNGQGCFLWFSQKLTPTVTSISLPYLAAGNQIRVVGKLLSKESNLPILAYNGANECRVLSFNATEKETENNELREASYILKLGGKDAGNQNLTIQLKSPFGRSVFNSSVFQVSRTEELYMVQRYPQIVNVTSSSSRTGGAMIVIHGSGFVTDASITVHVGPYACGQPKVEPSVLTCIIPQLYYTIRTRFYVGNRGVRKWYENISLVDSQAAAYPMGKSAAVTEDLPVHGGSDLPESLRVHFEMAFVAPKDSVYQFLVSGTNRSSLQGTRFRSFETEELMHGAETDLIEMQKDEVFQLHFQPDPKSESMLCVRVFNTAISSEQLPSSLPTIQRIRVRTARTSEIQEIDNTFLSNSKFDGIREKQKFLMDESIVTFKMCLYGACTSAINLQSTDDRALKSAIDQVLFSKGTDVELSKTEEGRYQMIVTFPLEFGDVDYLDIWYEQVNAMVEWEELTKGVTPLSDHLRPSYAGTPSIWTYKVDADPDMSEVLKAYHVLGTSICPDRLVHPNMSKTPVVYDFETPVDSTYSSTYAFCGSYSLKSPREISFDKVVQLKKYPHLCYAYRGELSGYMNVQYIEQNADGNETRKHHEFRAFDETHDKNRWRYTCNNLWEILTTADGIGGNVYAVLAFKLVPNQMLWKELAEFYVDTVSLSVQPTETDPDDVTLWPRSPFNNFMGLTVVRVDQWKLQIRIDSFGCEGNYGWFGIAGVSNTQGVDPDRSTEFRDNLWPESSKQTVVRIGKGSGKPLSGTVQLSFKGILFPPLSVDQESQKSAERILSMHPSLGTVHVVTRSGCSQMVYDIHFSLPGRQPLIEVVDQSGLNDENARVDVELVQDGHLLLCPIPGDMLFTVEPEPQVRVYVNEIPAKCVGTCAHNFDSSMTPRPIRSTVQYAGRKVMLAVQAYALDHEKPEYNQIIATHEGMIYNASIVSDSWAHFLDIPAEQIPAGVVKFQLYVMSKGYSETDFEVDFGELFAKTFSFDRNEGGLAGGTLLTIDGARFSKTAQVMLGDKECDVISVVYDEIQCLTPRGTTEGPVSIIIKQNGLTLHSQSSFHYKLDLTPSLFNVVPSDSLPVEGDVQLHIFGSGFNEETKVLIGHVELDEAELIDEGQLVITAPPVDAPGVYPLEISAESEGYGELALKISYVYEVTTQSAFAGSWLGGRQILFTGRNLAKTTHVMFKPVMNNDPECIKRLPLNCTFVESNTTHITCTTPSLSREHFVKNVGVDRVRGPGYRWEPSTLDVVEGDRVTWTWNMPTGQRIKLGIYEVNRLDHLLEVNNQTESPVSENGEYTRVFSNTGLYYYISSFEFPIFGLVRVRPIPDCLAHIVIMQNTVQATGAVNNSILQATENLHDVDHTCAGSRPCLFTQLKTDGKFDGQALFAFRQCMTPKFRQPKVQNDTLYIRFTFPMERVQLCSDQWRVTVDGFICIPEGSFSTDATQFTCQIPSMDLLKTNQTDTHLFTPRMNHPKLGYALFTGPSSIAASEHTLNLQISNRDSRLQQGSLYGGGLLHIFGSGFDSKRPDVHRIRLGHRFECIVQTVRHNKLVCRVQKIDKQQLDDSDTILLIYVLEMKNVNSSTWDTISCPGSSTQCVYSLNKYATPYLISVQPTMVTEAVLLRLTGENLLQADENVQQIEIMVGPIHCLAQAYNKAAKQLTCQLAARIPYGKNPISYLVNPRGYGFVPPNLHVTANIQLDRISPDSANQKQRTAVIKLTGNGLDLSGLTVRIGPFGCIPIDEVFSNPIEISCMLIMSNKPQLRQRTPVDLALYTTGPDPLLTVTNAFTFISDSGDPDTAGDIVCPIGPDFFPCRLTTHLGTGLQLPPETVSGLTMATGAFVRTELLTVTSIDPQIGSIHGGQTITIDGSGFPVHETTVLVCDQKCTNLRGTSSSMFCLTPAADMKSTNYSLEMTCDIKITVGKHNAVVKQAYTYLVNMTPVIHGISPQSGTTRGSTRLRLFGEMLWSEPFGRVHLGSEICVVTFQNDTNIECITKANWPGRTVNISVLTFPVGRAECDLTFQFIDRWSSESTWSPGLIPVQGDMVIIRESDVIVLDVNTPDLSMLLIDGGTLQFDPTKDLELRAKYILITNKGVLEIGTSEEPFTRKATIVLLGHARDKELPLYGSKVIAVRNGRLSIHGTHHPIMWARLAQTAMSGARKLKLDKSVTWPKGEMIIISSSTTGLEDEQHVITAFEANNTVLVLEKPLQYQKTVQSYQTVHGTEVLVGPEVGLFSSNVHIYGDVAKFEAEEQSVCATTFDWKNQYHAVCSAKLFEVPVRQHFGGHIFVGGAQSTQSSPLVQMENVLLSSLGQAGRPGSHPIYFHMSGKMPGSYVRNCIIRLSQNRGVVLRHVQELVLENNIFHGIKGSAIMLVDGAETGNVLRNNLVIRVRLSRFLDPADLEPAAFWISNPDNKVEGNVAAGGIHTAFRYELPERSSGLLANTHLCPQSGPAGRFENNVAHGYQAYALLIQPAYWPTKDGQCHSNEWSTAVFNGLIGWNNQFGVHCQNCGPVEFSNMIITSMHNHTMHTEVTPDTRTANNLMPTYFNLVLIADRYQTNSKVEECKTDGIILPSASGLQIKQVTFQGFNGSACAAIRGPNRNVSTCMPTCGGHEIEMENITWIDTSNRVRFDHPFEFFIRDLDGSVAAGIPNVTIIPGALIVPYSEQWPRDQCGPFSGVGDADLGPSFSQGKLPGVRCDPEVMLIRLSLYNVGVQIHPKEELRVSLFDKLNSSFTNSTTISGNDNKWVIFLVSGNRYILDWMHGLRKLYNLNYEADISGFRGSANVTIRHVNIPAKPNYFRISVNGAFISFDDQLRDPKSQVSGWASYNESGKFVEYFFNFNESDGEVLKINFEMRYDFSPVVDFSGIHLEEEEITGKPTVFLWSERETWTQDVITIPRNGSTFTVGKQVHLKMDTNVTVSLSTILVQGILEFESGSEGNERAYYLQFQRMLIDGGTLIAGHSVSDPLSYASLVFHLRSQSNDTVQPSRNNSASNVMDVLGQIQLHATRRHPSWVRLAETAPLHATELHLIEAVQDWQLGDLVVVAATGKHYRQTENAIIRAISSDRRTITIDRELNYQHVAYNKTFGTELFQTGAEVAVIHSNIVIRSDFSTTHPGSSGYLTLHNSWRKSNRIFGHQFSGVLFDGLGGGENQNAAVQFYRLQSTHNGTSYMVGCMFRNSGKAALIVNKTNDLLLKDNVFYDSHGPGMILTGTGHKAINNLFITTNCSSSVPVTELEDEQAVVDITEADQIMWKDNTIAGASCVGLKTRGSPCVSYLPETERDTVIHTCPLGVLNTQSRRFCAQLHYLKIYSTSHVAVFWSRASAIGAHHIQLVDNEIGFYPVLEQVRRAAFFQRANTLLIRESLVVGRSGLQPCDGDGEQLLVRSLPKPVKSVGHVGAVISQFIYPFNSQISDEPWEVNGAFWEKITFVNFGHWCATDKDVVLRSDMSYRNSIQNALFRQTKVINVPDQNMLLYQQPSRPENILYCGELECDSSKQVFILDTDGGLFGKPTVALPRYAFTQDALRYIKMNFPLRRRLTARGIDLIPTAIWPYHGVARDRACIREGRRHVSLCSIQPEHRLLLIQPLDVNKVKAERLGPAVFTTEHNSEGFIDLINGRISCKDAECKMSREVFPLIVTNASISSVYFTRQNPDALHLRLSEAEDTYKMHLQIDYRQGARLDVYVQKNYRLPQNGVMDEMGQVLMNTSMSLAEAMSDLTIHPIGTNFYEPEKQLLHVIVGGSRGIVIKATSYLKLTLNVDASILLNEFYAGNLRVRLAKYLGLQESQVIVSQPAAEALEKRLSRVARAAARTIPLEIMIEQPPQSDLDLSIKNPIDFTSIQAHLEKSVKQNILNEVLDVAVESANVEAFVTDSDREQATNRDNSTHVRVSQHDFVTWHLSVEPTMSKVYENVPFTLRIGIMDQNNKWVSQSYWKADVYTDEHINTWRGSANDKSNETVKLMDYVATETGNWTIRVQASSPLWPDDLTLKRILTIQPNQSGVDGRRITSNRPLIYKTKQQFIENTADSRRPLIVILFSVQFLLHFTLN